MIFITYNENFEVEFMHYMPFDSENGLGKTKEELLIEGALVEEIPQVEVVEGKMPIYKYNDENNTVYCELVDRPLTQEEKNIKKIEELTVENQSQNDLIDTMMLATDEIFTMIEPLISSMSINMRGGISSAIGEFYLAIVKRELKNIDEIPLVCKEYVENRLK